MKRYLIAFIIVLVLISAVLTTSCSLGLQTFNKYGISFKVAKELSLVEYTVDLENMTSRIGNASYDYGAIMSTDKKEPAIYRFLQERVFCRLTDKGKVEEEAWQDPISVRHPEFR